MSYARPFLSLIGRKPLFSKGTTQHLIPTVRLETESALDQGLGSKSGKVATFYGIPHGEPPVGDLRLRAPVPLTPFSEEEGENLIMTPRAKPNICLQGPANPYVMRKAGKPSYIYGFDQPNSVKEGQLVHHSADNWWMFQGSNTGADLPGDNGTYALTPFNGASQKRFSKELIAYWIPFVHTGNPNALQLPGSPEWPMWSNAKGKTQKGRMVFKQGTELSMGRGVSWRELL